MTNTSRKRMSVPSLLAVSACVWLSGCTIKVFVPTSPEPAPPLVLMLDWLTHLGAVTLAPGGSNAGSDECNAVAVDSAGNSYCAGETTGAMGEANGGNGNEDSFILKYGWH